jgi:group I intron endonuclease
MNTIYQIRNRINNKVYIGKTMQTVDGRWKQHILGHGNAPYLYSAIQKHGPEKFDVWVLYPDAVTEEELNQRETLYIQMYKSNSPRYGYNLTAGGRGLCNPSPETRHKLSETMKGKKKSKEHRRKLSEANKGKRASKETRLKMSKSQKGNKNSLGYKHTEEGLRKIREAQKGRKFSKETRRKISEASKRENLSAETRRKRSEAAKGNKYALGAVRSAETRRKISKARMKRRILRKGRN